ncbi:MAG: hypothetical protein ABSH08_18825 [Tepidisphaeraceae bacterium]
MPLLLRKIRKNRWYRDKKPEWLQPGDVPADSVTDLKTTDNKLSVYQCNDPDAEIDRVVAALAASGPVDYALIDRKQIDEAEISMQPSPGTTPDEKANGLHHDLVALSGEKILRLAKIIFDDRVLIKRVLPKKVMEMISAGIAAGRISRDKLSEKMRSKIPDSKR